MGADQRLNDANAHEELLGEPAAGVAQKQTVDALLGRPYVAERSVVRGVGRGGPDHASRTPEERFADLQELTRAYLSPDEEALLARAFAFANAAHRGQCRKSGEPFVVHPIEVGIILADLRDRKSVV